jgi:hypothetical protein
MITRRLFFISPIRPIRPDHPRFARSRTTAALLAK